LNEQKDRAFLFSAGSPWLDEAQAELPQILASIAVDEFLKV
jgi:hypothetical protein